jgi:hypothetical protein
VSDDFLKKSSDTHGFLKPELASTTLGMTSSQLSIYYM